ncbi:beta-D-glucuronidase [Escherichia coli]|uniref:Beta-D-glucuronidase n=1 Tax=Escherichia coli TaxID=562 RepID=A0A377BBQ7_ECOLX|nr:beta-D-glucuronidase [Escherichia coli]
MLRPVETPTREIKKLDGLWAFSLDRENCGIDQRWWESALQEAGQLLCQAVLTISSPMQIFVIMRATSGISAKSLYRRLGRPAYRAAFRCGHSLRQSVGQ